MRFPPRMIWKKGAVLLPWVFYRDSQYAIKKVYNINERL